MKSTVKDVMTTRVIAARPDAPYKELAALLRDQRISAFPVVDDEHKVIGIVSETDLLAKEAFAGTLPRTAGSLRQRLQTRVNALTAGDLMTTPAVTIGPDQLVAQAARLMYTTRVKRLPVVDEAGKLIGIVARSDVLSVYGRSDAEIKHEVTEDLILGTFLCDPFRFTVTVSHGIVTIEGKPESATVGRDIVSAIRHMEGAVSVRDRLSDPAVPAHRARESTKGRADGTKVLRQAWMSR
jgi:CBS domain-containing protein